MGTEIVAIPFGDDEILATQDEQGNVRVVVKRICESLGVSVQKQLEKLKRTHWATVTIMVTVDASGDNRETCVIPLDDLPMWLATIAPGRVRPEFREKLKRYQLKARDVLAKHFFGTPQSQWESTPSTSTGQMLQMARGLVSVLEVQEKQEIKLNAVESRQADQESIIREQQAELARIKHEREHEEARLADLEARSREQLEQIAKAQADADRAVRTVTSEADWFCLVTWAETQGIYLAPGIDSREGKIITAMCRAEGIEPKRMATPRYPLKPNGRGGVQYYPLHMLRRWLVDYLRRNPLRIGT